MCRRVIHRGCGAPLLIHRGANPRGVARRSPRTLALRATARNGRKDRFDCAATRAQLIAMAAVQEGARALRPRTTAEPTEGRDPEEGATTVEYAIGTIAAAGFAGLLIVILKSDTVRAALESIIQEALNTR